MAEPTRFVTEHVRDVMTDLAKQATYLIGLLDTITSAPLAARTLAAENWSSHDTASLNAALLRAAECSQKAASHRGTKAKEKSRR